MRVLWLLLVLIAAPAAGSDPIAGSGPVAGVDPAAIPGCVLHVEARDLIAGDAARKLNVATCTSAACLANSMETATAAESFCDTQPISVAGATGHCAPHGCARFAVDRSPLDWQLGMDDPEKLCLVEDCVGGQPCFRGHEGKSGVWQQGATLEIYRGGFLDQEQIAAGQDFSFFALYRRSSQTSRACLVGMSIYHLCIEPDGAVYLRLDGFSSRLTAAQALPKERWHLLEVHRQDGALEVWADGIDVTKGSPRDTEHGFWVGYLLSLYKGQGAATGDLAWLSVFQRALSQEERAAIRAYSDEIYVSGQ